MRKKTGLFWARRHHRAGRAVAPRPWVKAPPAPSPRRRSMPAARRMTPIAPPATCPTWPAPMTRRRWRAPPSSAPGASAPPRSSTARSHTTMPLGARRQPERKATYTDIVAYILERNGASAGSTAFTPTTAVRSAPSPTASRRHPRRAPPRTAATSAGRRRRRASQRPQESAPAAGQGNAPPAEPLPARHGGRARARSRRLRPAHQVRPDR